MRRVLAAYRKLITDRIHRVNECPNCYCEVTVEHSNCPDCGENLNKKKIPTGYN